MTIGEQFTVFSFDSDYHNNACLNYGFHNLDLYARGYKLAADSKVGCGEEQTASTRGSRFVTLTRTF